MKIPKWSTLRTIGNLWVVKLTILIPLVGYFIVFNAKLSQYIQMVTEVSGIQANQISVSPRLFEVYFSLCFIAVGSTVYAFFCPPTIKQYETAPNYVAADVAHLSDFEFDRIGSELKASTLSDEFRKINARYQGLEVKSSITEGQKNQVNVGTMHLHYRFLDTQFPYLRFIVCAAYCLGFILLSIPSARVFVKVFQVLWDLLSTYGVVAL